MAFTALVRLGVLTGLACILAAPAAARPAAHVKQTPVVMTVPGSVYFGYAPPVVIVEKGGTLTYSNLDSTEHDFVQDVEADGFGGPKKAPWCKKLASSEEGHRHAHGCPAFYTPLLGSGGSAEVRGLANVKPGVTYTFFCTRHHSMQGTLIVE